MPFHPLFLHERLGRSGTPHIEKAQSLRGSCWLREAASTMTCNPSTRICSPCLQAAVKYLVSLVGTWTGRVCEPGGRLLTYDWVS